MATTDLRHSHAEPRAAAIPACKEIRKLTTPWIFTLLVLAANTFAAEPATVHFQSENHQTNLVGYLFLPSGGGAVFLARQRCL